MTSRERARERWLPRAAWIAEYKLAYGCADCGYAKHACALEFDHRPGEQKRFGISAGLSYSWRAILDEIAKCDIVCANCHAVRTHVTRRDGEAQARDTLVLVDAEAGSTASERQHNANGNNDRP